MSPSFGLPHQSPSALQRVPAGRVPRLRRYYQGATTPCRSSRRASLPSLGGTILCTLASLLSAWRATPRAWGFCSTLRLPHPDSGGNDRASHVPGEPSCAYALLFDPGGTDAPGHRDAPTRPPCEPRRRLPRAICLYGAQSHGLCTRCLRFAAPVTRTPRKTRFRLLASSTGRDSLPAGFLRKVSDRYSSMAITLLSQAFVAQGP